MKLAKIVKRCRIDKPEKFKLADVDPAECFGLSTDIEKVRAILADGVARLEDTLYAHARWAVLIVLQGMDAAGKDGVIKHVMSGINPQGCVVHAFKAPGAEELAHNFLWRVDKYLPERAYRHLQSLALRGSAGGARAFRSFATAEAAAERDQEEHLETSLPGHSRLRAPPDVKRNAGAEVPFAYFQERTTQALLGAAEGAVQAVEIFAA